METIELIFRILMANWQRALTGGIIVACVAIFLTGALKKAWLGKIKNKLLRKALLWLASLVLSFPTTALYFVGDNISFRWYWYACALMCFFTTVTYVFYENTGLRDIIHWIGGKTVGKYASVLVAAWFAAKDNEDTTNKLTMTTDELKEVVKTEMKKQYKEDPNLKNI
ncbi:MAG: hypothetical protein IJ459_04555 [Clostridia bacterium]|nr:hypothetical protein [Clostridia bacterium]